MSKFQQFQPSSFLASKVDIQKKRKENTLFPFYLFYNLYNHQYDFLFCYKIHFYCLLYSFIIAHAPSTDNTKHHITAKNATSSIIGQDI